MKTAISNFAASWCAWWILAGATPEPRAAIVFETKSPFHHIQVIDADGMRVLSFNGFFASQMLLRNPALGHFSYTELFHLPWLWTPITNVLMIGLGGGSTQRAYQRLYTNVTVETVEMDAAVVLVAKRFFHVQESSRHIIHIGDGRDFLERSEKQYEAILMDSYAENRLGAFIPHHLATKEFFEVARTRLSENGVVAYNVVGTLLTWRTDVAGSVYRTMRSVFPQVYIFPAPDWYNVVFIGTKNPRPSNLAQLQQRARQLTRMRTVNLPYFVERAGTLYAPPPPHFHTSPLLTDQTAPADGLLRGVLGY